MLESRFTKEKIEGRTNTIYWELKGWVELQGSHSDPRKGSQKRMEWGIYCWDCEFRAQVIKGHLGCSGNWREKHKEKHHHESRLKVFDSRCWMAPSRMKERINGLFGRNCQKGNCDSEAQSHWDHQLISKYQKSFTSKRLEHPPQTPLLRSHHSSTPSFAHLYTHSPTDSDFLVNFCYRKQLRPR